MGRRSCVLLWLFALTLPLFHFQPSHPIPANSVVLDGISEWDSQSIQVGDTLVFRHQELEKLYLFHSRNAFDRCNFAQATLVYQATSNSDSFPFRPTRPGYYYFAATSGSLGGCEAGEKVPVRVISSAVFSPATTAPPPTSGGDLPSFPSDGWGSTSPETVPEAKPVLPGEGPSPAPASNGEGTGEGIPFISSSPAVPIPTGETDTATIRPLPLSGDGTQVVGQGTKKDPIQMEVVLVAGLIIFSALNPWLRIDSLIY